MNLKSQTGLENNFGHSSHVYQNREKIHQSFSRRHSSSSLKFGYSRRRDFYKPDSEIGNGRWNGENNKEENRKRLEKQLHQRFKKRKRNKKNKKQIFEEEMEHNMRWFLHRYSSLRDGYDSNSEAGHLSLAIFSFDCMAQGWSKDESPRRARKIYMFSPFFLSILNSPGL